MSHDCSALYNHTNIRNGNRIYPCCRFKKQLLTFDDDVENILNTKIEFEFGLRREGDPSRLIADGTLAKKQLST